MATLRKRRCSYSLLGVLAIGVIALIASSFQPPVNGELFFVVPIAAFLTACVYLFWVEFLKPLTMNGECPVCHKRSMRRIARTGSFFECAHCRVRLRRPSPLAEWEDASESEADELYRSRSNAGLWGGYAKPRPGKTTSGTLLINKRSRGLSPALDDTDVPATLGQLQHEAD